MNYAVHCPTQQDYDTLMQAYEKKGWIWNGGEKPTSINNWINKKSKTAIDFHDRFYYSTCTNQEFFGYTIITLKEALTKLNMPRTIEQVQRGDLLKGNGYFIRVLDVRGEGELALVDISDASTNVSGGYLKTYGSTYTLYELKARGYTIYEPEETTEVLGKKYKTSELTDRLKELKEVE